VLPFSNAPFPIETRQAVKGKNEFGIWAAGGPLGGHCFQVMEARSMRMRLMASAAAQKN
jgi:hypothetical protein